MADSPLRLCIISNLSIHTQRLTRYLVEAGHEVHLLSFGAAQVPMPHGVVLHDLEALAPVLACGERSESKRSEGAGRRSQPSPLGAPASLPALDRLPSPVVPVVSAANPSEAKERRGQGGLPPTPIGGGKLRWPVWVRAVRRLVRDIRPDVLHAHQIATAGWLGAAAGYHPFVATAWGSDLMVGAQRSWPQRQLARWVLRRADYVSCVSHSLAQVALRLGADPSRLEVAPWGVDVDVYHPAQDRAALRVQLRWGSGAVVLSPRSLKAVYRPLDLAQAIPHVLCALPDASFVVRTHNSDPQLLAQFQAAVVKAGATEAVRYVGELPDEAAIADLYRASDVAVSVPVSDGTPSSVLEAMACGAVPVVSDVPSLHEWVAHEQEALFVPVGDARALSDAIVRLLTDRQLRARMAANGAALIRERADSRVWMRRYEQIYRNLLPRCDAPRRRVAPR